MISASAVSRHLGKSFDRSVIRSSRVRGFSTATEGFQVKKDQARAGAVRVEFIAGARGFRLSAGERDALVADMLNKYAEVLRERWNVQRDGNALIVTEKGAEEPAEAPEPVTVDAPTTSCPSLATPGNIHFMTAHCIECNAFRMSKMSPDTVEQWYRSGHFSQDEYEAYMHAWATGTHHYGSTGGWAEEPTDPKVMEIVTAIRRHAGIPAPATLAA
jgi:ferredoxin-like protein FixX